MIPLPVQRKERSAMTNRPTTPVLIASLAAAMLAGGVHNAAAQLPAAIVAPPGETALAAFHAEGAQVYECKAGNDSKLAWNFREPIATLLLDGKTVGRHYAGPSWEHVDRQRRDGKGRRQRAGPERRRHSLAQARSNGASRQRHA